MEDDQEVFSSREEVARVVFEYNTLATMLYTQSQAMVRTIDEAGGFAHWTRRPAREAMMFAFGAAKLGLAAHDLVMYIHNDSEELLQELRIQWHQTAN